MNDADEVRARGIRIRHTERLSDGSGPDKGDKIFFNAPEGEVKDT